MRKTNPTTQKKILIPKNRLNEFAITALDFPDGESALKLVDALGEDAVFYKVGMELFFAEGQKIIEALKAKNKKIFLDLKLHDIPATMERSVRVLSHYGIDLLTVFCGTAGVEAAKRGASKSPLKILNVTVLTSEQIDDVSKSVLDRARLTKDAGGDGIICSGLETRFVREAIPEPLLIVNPGIRPAGFAADDQKRVVTPKQALEAGADHIVVGRPITRAENPREVFRMILHEIGSENFET